MVNRLLAADTLPLPYRMARAQLKEFNNMSMIDRQRESARRQIERAEARLAFLDSLPDEPEPDETGSAVIWFVKNFNGGKPYTYAAVLADNGLWYTTGPAAPKGYPWEELIRWILDGNDYPGVWQATEWEAIN